MTDNITIIQDLKEKVKKFINERDWEKFHSPKSLSMSLAIEAAELMEKFQWLDNEESKDEIIKNKKEIEEELADILTNVICFSNLYNIDLSKAIERKLEINKKKYPVEKCKGKSDKYTKINS